MTISRIAGTVLFLICVAHSSRATSQDDPAAPVAVRPASGWTNVFAGKSTTLKVLISSQAVVDATLNWSVSVERGVIARGDRPLNLKPDSASEVALEVDFPELRSGVVAPAALTLDVRSRGGDRVQRNVALHVFSPDVTAGREQWAKSLDIVLFDPARTTATALESVRIPCRFADGPSGVQVGTGLILFGEGIEPARLDAAWQSAVEAASSGRRVIVLASPGGSIPVDGLLTRKDGLSTGISLRGNDVIRDFDKRLDYAEWTAPGRVVASSLHWAARGESPRIEFRDNSSGWPWLDLRYRNGGRLVCVGFGVIESWEATPAARYLFLKLLEDVMTEKTELGGPKHAEK